MKTRIKTGDTVKIIAGANKGQSGKVSKVEPKKNLVYVEGINVRERHFRPSMYRPGGKKEIHVGLDASKVALADKKETK